MKTTINVKVDLDTKTKAQEIAGELGLSLSAIVNAQLKELVRTKTVVFSTEPSYHMTPYLEKIIEEFEQDRAQGRDLGPVLSTPKEIDAYFSKLERQAVHAGSNSSKTRKTTSKTNRG